MSNAGQLAGAILSGVCAGYAGRRRTMALLCAALSVAFIVAAFSGGNTWVLVVSRVLQGFGIVSTVNQVMIIFYLSI